jgi:GT2 family glycosyltransferase
VKVAVCAVTYLRPRGLARLLEGLCTLRLEGAQPPELEIVVVDNDPARSAEAVCDEWSDRLPWPLRYRHEERRGVSHARNAAVAAAREAGADLMAFIDDDEVPQPGWLSELLRVQARHGADVVAGPVLPVFEGEVPDWVKRGGFFEAPRLPTGTHKRDPGAGNVLIRMAVLGNMPEPFDPRFTLTGGEDTHLFLRLAAAGAVMVWADEAVAHEWTPATRTRARWILQRVYRTANTWSACEREIDPSAGAAAMRVAKGLARIGIGVATLPAALVRGRSGVVRSLWYVCWGAGNLTGLTPLRFQEYRTIHGD